MRLTVDSLARILRIEEKEPGRRRIQIGVGSSDVWMGESMVWGSFLCCRALSTIPHVETGVSSCEAVLI